MAQQSDSLVLNDDGDFILLGQVTAGTTLVSGIGTPAKVEAVQVIAQEVFEVEFDDGTVVDCTGNTRWHFEHNAVPFTTLELIEYLQEHETLTYRNSKGFIPEVGWDLPISSEFLGMLLSEPDPVEGFLYLTTNKKESLHRMMSTLPSYALQTPGEERWTFVYPEESLKTDESYGLLTQANLFSGDSNQFKIPHSIFHTSCEDRLNFMYGFCHSMPGGVDVTKLDFDHPTLGEGLKKVLWSLGWSLQGTEYSSIVRASSTGRKRDMRRLKLEHSSTYVTEGYKSIGLDQV